MSIDHNNPTFQAFAYNNNRTAWRPIGFPVIMVVPRRKDVIGAPIANSQVFNVKIIIENVPREARVAGHDNIGLLYPDEELYVETLSSQDLGDRVIDVSNLDVYRDGQIVDNPQTGDIIHYTTSTGTQGTIEYITGAMYYDLSDIAIEVETLPSDNYNLVYQAEYFTRVVSKDARQDLLCIDVSSTSLAILRLPIQHPGSVMDEFYRHTPPPYLTNAKRSLDTTVDLYRPLTDVLQDVADEQLLMESINYVFDTPAEAIPYLSQLLGWDLPYFPRSLDDLRKAVLRRTVEFQNLKGSRRAIINLFRLFGFEILISNLWWSSDGEILIRPTESLPPEYKDEEIDIVQKSQTDAILANWSEDSFGEFQVHLLYRPQVKTTIDDFTALRDGGDVRITTYLVKTNSDGYTELTNIVNELKNQPDNSIDLLGRMNGRNIQGRSIITISGKFGEAIAEWAIGAVPITKNSVVLDRDANVLTLSFTGVVDNNETIFVFADYERQQLVIPDVLTDLQSNRFDLTVVTEDLQELADPVVLEFAIEFLYRLKAFHSLLRVIRQRIDLTETYEVTDLCVGGDVIQWYDTDIGRLQVPPAIIPDIPGTIDDCTKLDPEALGYKPSDLILRNKKLENLAQELQAWANLDNRKDVSGDTRLAPLPPVPGREAFFYTRYGQDRIVPGYENNWGTEYGPDPNSNQEETGITQLAPQDYILDGQYNTTGPDAVTNSDSSEYSSFIREYRKVPQPWIILDDKTDYCYKGRVEDELLYRLGNLNNESYRCRPCKLGLGSGVYYIMPSRSKKAAPGNRNRLPGSMSNKIRFTGNAPEENLEFYSTGLQSTYLKASYNEALPSKQNSLLGRFYQNYDQPEPETLHYTNRPIITLDQRYQLALQRPELDIQKADLHLPGCRFPMINALTNDYISTVYKARPWDDLHSTFCGPREICLNNDPTMLNVHKIVGTDGNEYLVYDDEPYTALGNGLTPDIPSLGSHALLTGSEFTADEAIHKIYACSDDSPYVELDQLCACPSDDSTINVDTPVFSSYQSCDTGGYTDFMAGYGCVKGYQSYTTPSDPLDYVCVENGTEECNLKTDLLGIPTGGLGNYLISLSSGILITTGYRLDCGCSLVGCGETELPSAFCSLSDYYDQDGELDTNCDHYVVERNMVLEENVGGCSIRLDGSIPTLMEITF